MDLNFLADTPLFHQVMPQEMEMVLDCLKGQTGRYQKGEIIFSAGSGVQAMGVILTGRVSIVSDDPWGGRSLLDHLGPGEIFAEIYACVPKEPMLVSAMAEEETEVLFLHPQRLLEATAAHPALGQVLRNLFSMIAQKNLALSRRIQITASKTIRGRLLTYFSFEAKRQSSTSFHIPLNRQQMADYLGVERSALSHELSKMQKEGMITYRKNEFCLKKL